MSTTTNETAAQLIARGMREEKTTRPAATPLPAGWGRLSANDQIEVGLASEAGRPIPAALAAKAARLDAAAGAHPVATGPALTPLKAIAAQARAARTPQQLIAEGLKAGRGTPTRHA